MKNMIDIQNVSKDFGEKRAVNNLNLTIPKGELFAFLGPNGAGKTTTIKMLTGLLYPSEGTIKIKGFNTVGDHLEIKKFFSYIPDEPYLYDKLTGREFLQFVGEMYGLEQEEVQSRIEELATLFEANSYLDYLGETYSHGMKQRVVIASMLLHNPEVVVIDEPMVGLDPSSARLFKDTLRDITSQGTTVFMSTHTLSVAEELAHRIGIIFQGELVALGTFEELQDQYQLQGKSLEEIFLQITSRSEEESNVESSHPIPEKETKGTSQEDKEEVQEKEKASGQEEREAIGDEEEKEGT